MPKRKTPKGLAYKALDLHVHTPASSDYKEKTVSAEDIVAAAVDKGLSGICVTDHNTAEWVDKVAEAAKGQPLTVFPGFEISVTGGGKEGSIHIIGIFDPDRTAEELNDALSDLKLTAAKRGKTTEIADGSPNDVIDAIARHGGLPVLAHADSSHGVLADMRGRPRIKVIRNPRLVAAEVSNEKYRKHLDGTDPNYKRDLPTYEASDAHAPGEIGTKFSHFKLQHITLAGLRQCFFDHPVRIKLADIYKPLPITRIGSIALSQGFFEGEDVEFHNSLNTLVGGQGVGKSLLVEFIRFALDQISTIKDVATDTEDKLSEQLGLGGEVTLVVELSNGTRYQIQRTYDGSKNPLVVTNADTGEVFEGDIASLFPVMAYSQTEVISIARDPNAQRRLIDQFVEAATYEGKISDFQAKLRKNGRQLVKVLDAKDELADVKKQVKTIEEAIRNVERSLKNPIFAEMKAIEQQKGAFNEELKYHDALISALDDFAEELGFSQKPPSLTSQMQKNPELKAANDLSKSSLKLVKVDLEAVKTKIRKNKVAAKKHLSKWLPAHAEVKKRYDDLLAETGGDQRRLELKRRNLLDQKGDLDTKAKDLLARARRLDRTLAKRGSLLDELDQTRDSLYETRKQKYDELTDLSDGKLRLALKQGSDPEAFSKALQALATGTHIRKTEVVKIAERVSPREFIDLVISNDVDTLATKGNTTTETAGTLVGWLRALPSQEDVLELQHKHLPEDVPSIRFKKEDGQYYDLSGLSTGQKCTALLIIALSTGDYPVIVDQPEEAIDIAFIYSDIVSKLRYGKEQRQFILTTHNPNIAVSADSDLMHVLKSSATHGHIEYSGAIDDDEVRQEAIQHLEGGTQAYLLRGKKYRLIRDDSARDST